MEPTMCLTPSPSSKVQSTEGWVRGQESITSTQLTLSPILFQPVLTDVHSKDSRCREWA